MHGGDICTTCTFLFLERYIFIFDETDLPGPIWSRGQAWSIRGSYRDIGAQLVRPRRKLRQQLSVLFEKCAISITAVAVQDSSSNDRKQPSRMTSRQRNPRPSPVLFNMGFSFFAVQLIAQCLVAVQSLGERNRAIVNISFECWAERGIPRATVPVTTR